MKEIVNLIINLLTVTPMLAATKIDKDSLKAILKGGLKIVNSPRSSYFHYLKKQL